MTYLAIDYGTKRLGLAISDPDHKFAVPWQVLTEPETWLTKLPGLCAQKSVTRVVIGFPKNLKGQDTASTERMQKFKLDLEKVLTLPIDTFDERLSTVHALGQQRSAGISQKKGRATIDALAACHILEGYLLKHLKQDLGGQGSKP